MYSADYCRTYHHFNHPPYNMILPITYFASTHKTMLQALNL